MNTNRSKSKDSRTTFNKEMAKSTMKAMLGGNSVTNSQNVQNINPNRGANTIEIRNSRVAELEKLNKAEKKRIEINNTTLCSLSTENKESSQLLNFYRQIVDEKKRQLARLKEEDNIDKYKHMMGGEESFKQLDVNLRELNGIRDQIIHKVAEIKTRSVFF
jgi:hypothetical protein